MDIEADPVEIRRRLTPVQLKMLRAVGAAERYVPGPSPHIQAETEALRTLEDARLVALWPGGYQGSGQTLRLTETGRQVLAVGDVE